jgi:5-methyltetrahydropteroyltriglutamate--homocysteine methyltransferase
MGRHMHVDLVKADGEQFRAHVRRNVAAIDHATRNIDPDQLRMHLCWGNYEGPHHHDVDLADILDLVLEARPNGIALEASNPRHQHEFRLFDDVDLPDGKLLIPGVIDSKSNYIEHPELVAQRLVRYAERVGRENVMAGTDCGFGTFAGNAFVVPQIMWAKFEAMAEGARLADRALAAPRAARA